MNFLGSSQGHIALADVMSTNFSDNGSLLLTLGNTSSGEIYTTSAILMNAPGVYSVPLPPGVINSDGSFTAQSTSVDGAQAVCWVRNDQWFVLVVRDVRTQTNATDVTVAGELLIQAQGTTSRIVIANDGSITLTNPKGSVVLNSSGITLQSTASPAITFGNGDDKVALASVVDANFQNILTYLMTIFPSPGTTSLVAPSGGGPVTGGGPAPTTNASGSKYVSTQ